MTSNALRTKFPTLLLRSSAIFADNITSSHSIYAKQQTISAQIIYALLAARSLRNHFHQRQGLAIATERPCTEEHN